MHALNVLVPGGYQNTSNLVPGRYQNLGGTKSLWHRLTDIVARLEQKKRCGSSQAAPPQYYTVFIEHMHNQCFQLSRSVSSPDLLLRKVIRSKQCMCVCWWVAARSLQEASWRFIERSQVSGSDAHRRLQANVTAQIETPLERNQRCSFSYSLQLSL